MKNLRNLSFGLILLLMASFSGGTSTSWKVKVNKSGAAKAEEVKSSTGEDAKKDVLTIKKTDILNLEETGTFSGDPKDVRHLVLMDSKGRKTIFSQVLKNTEPNTVSINLTAALKEDLPLIEAVDLLEITVSQNGKTEKKIQSFQFAENLISK